MDPTVKVVGNSKRQLACKLQDVALLEYGERLAIANANIAAEKDRAKAIKAELKSAETALDAERSRLAGIVRAKAEIRDVTVAYVRDYSADEYQEVREDTREVIFRRPLEQTEKQMSLLDVNEAAGSIGGHVLKVVDGEATEVPEE